MTFSREPLSSGDRAHVSARQRLAAKQRVAWHFSLTRRNMANRKRRPFTCPFPMRCEEACSNSSGRSIPYESREKPAATSFYVLLPFFVAFRSRRAGFAELARSAYYGVCAGQACRFPMRGNVFGGDDPS